jgi:hypothetical protein
MGGVCSDHSAEWPQLNPLCKGTATFFCTVSLLVFPVTLSRVLGVHALCMLYLNNVPVHYASALSIWLSLSPGDDGRRICEAHQVVPAAKDAVRVDV